MKSLKPGFLFLFVAGCATVSEPARYYTLDMRPSGAALCTEGVRVERFRAVEPLDRRNLMVKATSTRVEYYARAEWAASVEDVVARKLQVELGEVTSPAAASVLHGTVLAFEQQDQPDHTARAYAKIHIVATDAGAKRPAHALLEKTYEAEVSLPQASPDAAVVGLSRALEQIAWAIATDLRAILAREVPQHGTAGEQGK